MKASGSTRSCSDVWLVGQLLPVLDADTCRKQLPTNRLVLCRLFYDLKTNKLSLSAACNNRADEVLQVWVEASIPTTQKPNVVTKLKSLYEKHTTVGKNRKRQNDRQHRLETEFNDMLSKLFDIAHAECEKLIKIPEDWKFIQDQRGDRKMFFGEEDLEYKMRFERKQKRICEQAKREEKLKQQKVESSNVALAGEEEDQEFSPDDTNMDWTKSSRACENTTRHPSIQQRMSQSGMAKSVTSASLGSPTPSKKRCLMDDPLFVASLDRAKTTPRQAMHIVAPALKAIGVDVEDLTVSTSSIYRARKSVRQTLAQCHKEQFQPNTPLIAHFDGKLLPDNDGNLVDRMPVVVSGQDTEKLLAVPKLPAGTGEQMGNAVVKVLHDWEGVPQWLAGLCFDTTSSNTGIHSGAITVIQQAFDKHLLFLACRHHILEILSSAVFDLFFQSSGPQIELFSRFKKMWAFIDLTKCATLTEDTSGNRSLTAAKADWLSDRKSDVVAFLKALLVNEQQPRDDYLEFIKLALILLDEKQFAAHFSPPGAYHRARWMAKGIYCLKIYCFHEQFKLTPRELQALHRICLFTVTIYIKAWFCAPLTCNAPMNDLNLIQLLESYSQIDSQVAEVALKKMKGHLWYLSEDLVGLALFSDCVWSSEKRRMIAALKKPKKAGDKRRLDPKSVQSFQSCSLSDFVTEGSLNLFTALKIDQSFLATDPDEWSEYPEYANARRTVSAVRCVNDCAERAVKLATDFSQVLTTDETQRQLVFQMVEFHRQKIDEPLKKHYTSNE